MNTMDELLASPPNNSYLELLNSMGPARPNMAVVEPVAMPIPTVPSNTYTVVDPNVTNSDNDAHVSDEIGPSMVAENMSIEEMELDHISDAEFDSIDTKIKFNRSSVL